MKSKKTTAILVALATIGLLVFLHPMQAGAQSKTWDRGAGTNNWSDTENWNPSGVPTNADTVSIVAGGSGGSSYTVDYSYDGSGFTLGSLTITGNTTSSRNATLNLNSGTLQTGTLTLSNARSFFNLIGGTLTTTNTINLTAGTFSQTGGALNANFTQNAGTVGAGTLEILDGKNFTYSSGTFSGRLKLNNGSTGTFNANFIAAQGMENNTALAIGTGRTITLNGAGLDNRGTLTLSGGTLSAATIQNSGTFNQTSGTLTNTTFTQAGGTHNVGSGGTGTFAVGGGSTATYNLQGGALNAGTVTLSGSGTFTKSSGGTLKVGTLFNQSGGTSSFDALNIDGTGTADNRVNSYTLSGGTLTAPNVALSGGNFNQTGGTLNYTTFNASGGTHTVGTSGTGTLTIGSGNTYTLSGGTLRAATIQNSGTFNQTSGTLTNTTFTQAGGTHNVGSSGAGVLAVGTGNTTSYNLQGGALNAGTVTLSSGGTFNQTGGALNANFTQNAGTVGAGTLEILDGKNFTYGGGTFSGRLKLNSGSTGTFNANFIAGNGMENNTDLTIGTGRTITLNSTGLDNRGTLTLSGGTLSATTITNSGTFNQTSGTLTNTTFTQAGGTHNVGSSGAGVLAVGTGNTTSYNLQGGALNAGTVTLSSGGTFNQTGGALNANFTQSGGTVASGSTLDILDGNNFTYGGGTFSGRLKLNSGSTGTFNADFIAGNGMANLATLTLTKAGTAVRTVTLNGAGLDNSGSLTLGNYHTLTAGTFTNSGTFTQNGTSSSTLSATTITNSGTFNQTSGTLTNTTFTNAGTLTLSGGTLTSGTIALTDGSFTKTSGGTLKVSTLFNQSGGTSSFDALTVDGSGTTNNRVDSYTLSGGTLTAPTVSQTGGTFTLSGGTLTAPTVSQTGGTFTQSGGTLDANFTQGGGTVASGSTLDMRAGKTFTFNSGAFSGRLKLNSGSTAAFNANFTAGNGMANYTTLNLASTSYGVTLGGQGLYNAGTINVTGGTSSVVPLTIDSATIQNDGNINIRSAGSTNLSGMRFLQPNVTLSGTGTLTLGDPNNSYSNYLWSATSSGTYLTNEAGHTIRGKGYIGYRSTGYSYNGYLALLNLGTIIAEQNGTLQLDSSANIYGTDAFVTNRGTFQVASGATMQIVAAISGTGSATFANFAPGTGTTGTLTLGKYDIAGTLRTPLASTQGITTIGSSTGNNTEVILSGTGKIVKNDGTSDAIAGLANIEAKGILTLQNGKALATTATTFTNKGTVNVESGSGFTMPSGAVYNQNVAATTPITKLDNGSLTAGTINLSIGSFTKDNGGTLKVTTAFNQTGGTSDFDTLILDGTTNVKKYSLQGGTMRAGTVQLDSGGTYEQTNGTATSITDFNYNGGTITQATGTGISNIANFNYHQGTLPANMSRMAITSFNQKAGTLTFSTLTLPAASSSGAYLTYSLDGGTLNATTIDLNSGGTFRKTGGTLNYTTFNQNSGATDYQTGLTNSGTYNLRGGTMSASGPFNNSGTFDYSGGTLNTGFANTGTATFSGTGTRTVGGAVSNAGTANVQSDVSISGAYTQSAGTTQLNNTNFAASSIAINGGTLRGNGTITGPVTIGAGGTVSPGSSGIGTMAINGSYTQAGTLNVELLSLSSYDRLNITGAASFAGATLDLSLLGGYTPQQGNNFSIITYASLSPSGQFAAILGDPDGTGPLFYRAIYGATGLTIATVPIPPSVWLLGAGLLSLVGIRRFRR